MPFTCGIENVSPYLQVCAVLGTGNPSALTPYGSIIGQESLFVSNDCFPPEALPDKRAMFLRQPGKLKGKELDSWMRFLLGRQAKYLAGDPLVPYVFRWLMVKESKFSDVLVEPEYDRA